jgi:exodeoxyribonuclease VII large subunit
MLEGEGLFAAEHKRPLPLHPQALAIVTSPQAAALRDVLATLRRRAPHVRIDIYPTPVQGEGAAARIAAAIAAAANGDCDAIIVCRGGGSIEDIWAFNEEAVARAIRASRLPVVSGVGHETDFTIADFAADIRAPTPTAAAELLSPDREALVAGLALWQRRLARQGARDLAERNQQLDWLSSRLLHPAERLREQREALVGLRQRMARAAAGAGDSGGLHLNALAHRLRRARLDATPARTGLHHLGQRLDQAVRQQLTRSEGKLNGLVGGLIQLDPHAVLRRGYAIALAADGRAVRDAAGLHPGSPLNLTFARGGAAVTVTQVVPNDEDQ